MRDDLLLVLSGVETAVSCESRSKSSQVQRLLRLHLSPSLSISHSLTCPLFLTSFLLSIFCFIPLYSSPTAITLLALCPTSLSLWAAYQNLPFFLLKCNLCCSTQTRIIRNSTIIHDTFAVALYCSFYLWFQHKTVLQSFGPSAILSL